MIKLENLSGNDLEKSMNEYSYKAKTIKLINWSKDTRKKKKFKMFLKNSIFISKMKKVIYKTELYKAISNR